MFFEDEDEEYEIDLRPHPQYHTRFQKCDQPPKTPLQTKFRNHQLIIDSHRSFYQSARALLSSDQTFVPESIEPDQIQPDFIFPQAQFDIKLSHEGSHQNQHYQLRNDNIFSNLQFDEMQSLGKMAMSKENSIIPKIVDKYCQLMEIESQQERMSIENHSSLASSNHPSNRMIDENYQINQQKDQLRRSRISQTFSIKDMIRKSAQKSQSRFQELPIFKTPPEQYSSFQLIQLDQTDIFQQPYESHSHLFVSSSMIDRQSIEQQKRSNESFSIFIGKQNKVYSKYQGSIRSKKTGISLVHKDYSQINHNQTKPLPEQKQIQHQRHHQNQRHPENYQVKCACLNCRCQSFTCNCRRYNRRCNQYCQCIISKCKNHHPDSIVRLKLDQNPRSVIKDDIGSSGSVKSLKFEQPNFQFKSIPRSI